jgi:arylsulfatase A-like enzyme/predicted Zn-dependent protease
MRRRGWIFLILAGVGGLAGGVYRWGFSGFRPVPDGPNVLIVTIDTARADHFGCYGFEGVKTPNIDGLAREGVLFEHSAATVPITLPSHCSILTGLIPPRHGVRNNGTYFLQAEHTTLAELLHDEGYETAAFVSAYVLNSKYGLDQGFDIYQDAVHDSSAVVVIDERNARETTNLVLSWLRKEHERPYFLWVHYFDPHQAYVPLSPFREEYAQYPYAGEIAFVDSELGRILGAVDQGNTLTVVTADHGESLGQHGERTHAFYIYDSTIRVPLVIRYPDGRDAGTRSLIQTSSVDIMPTVLDVLGYEIPEGLDGDSLADLSFLKGQRRYAYCESIYPMSFKWHPLAGLRDGEWKWIQAPQPEVYNIQSDPHETKNLVEAEKEVAGRMEAFLDAIDPFANLGSTESHTEMTAEDQEKLVALGYMGSSIDTSVDVLADLPDPKDKIATYNKILSAKSSFAAGMLEEAEQKLREVLAEEPDTLDAVFFLGRVLLVMGKTEEATAFLKDTRRRLPEDVMMNCVLASLYIHEEMWEQAVQICREGLEISDREASLHDQMGVAYQGMGRWGEAIRCAEKALELDPDQAEYWNNLGATYFAMEEFENALKPLRRAVDLDDNLTEAWYNLGASLAGVGRYEEAEKAYLAALESDAGNSEALVQLTKVLLHRGKADEALARCEELREVRPDDPGTFYFMSVAYREKDDAANAIASLEEYLEHVPGFTPGYEELCRLLVEEGRDQEARKYARIAQAKGASLPDDLRALLGSPQGM